MLFGWQMLGFVYKALILIVNFSVLLGCKYNQWGQARSMGKLSQQGSFKEGLSQPLTVKTVYQIAPYLGVQWNF